MIRKTLIPLILAVSVTAFAQPTAPQEPSPEQLKQLVNVLRAQRDTTTQQLQDLQVQLQLLSKENEDLKKQLAEATKPKAEPKKE